MSSGVPSIGPGQAMARPLDMIGRAAGPTWPDLSNQHSAMTANLMMDIMSSSSDREVSSYGFCAVKIIVSIQYSQSIPRTVVTWFETLTHQLNITTIVLVMLSCTEWI